MFPHRSKEEAFRASCALHRFQQINEAIAGAVTVARTKSAAFVLLRFVIELRCFPETPRMGGVPLRMLLFIEGDFDLRAAHGILQARS
jgi:hypothetical protein